MNLRTCPGCNGTLADWEAFACEACFKLHTARKMEGYRQAKPFVRSEASLNILALTHDDRIWLKHIGVAAC